MTTGDARFVEIYEQHYRKVYAYCARRTAPDQVDDAVADTFLTAWRKIDEVPADEGILPWLYAVAYRVLGHQWRSTSRRNRLNKKLQAIGVEYADAPEGSLVLDLESRQVLDALSRLRRADQELLRLTVWEELKHAEIAQVLGIGTVAVKKRASRARKSLARELERTEKRDANAPAAQEGGTW